MNDFVINKKERTSKDKATSFVQATEKQQSVILKVVVFFVAFFGVIYLSISSNNLMLTELLVAGGILSQVFLVHLLSNR